MKKLLLPALGCAFLLFSACKENGPAIDFGPAAKDTAYMASVETTRQDRVVVIEEFTGVSCAPCVSGHKDLKRYEEQYPDRLAILGIQPSGPAQSKRLKDEPPHEGIFTRHDNVTADGTDLSVGIYGGIGSMPFAGIDRIGDGQGPKLLSRPEWASTIASRLAMTPAANITITSSYAGNAHQAVIKVRVAYTQAVSKTQMLNVAIIENDVVDAQEGGDTVNFTKDYVHQHVFRDMLTAATGSTILSGMATKQAGQVYERTFVYNVDAAWNPDNCEIVAYVSNNEGGDKEVQQGAIVHLR